MPASLMNFLPHGRSICNDSARAAAWKRNSRVSTKVAIASEPNAARGVHSGEPETNSSRGPELGQDWLQRNQNALAMLIVAAGFAIRLVNAGRSFFNPDEALLFLFSDQPSIWQAYKASLGTAHPPLLILFLYFWRFLGRSELMLRLPSVLAGAGFCWFTFRWMEKAFSGTAGVVALVIAAFSPTLIGIAIELRQYSLLVFFLAAALYYLEAALQSGSAREMWAFHFFLYLAILTHYSAVFFVVAAGVYALVRIAAGRQGKGAATAWVAGQCAAAGLYAGLFVTHVWKVRGEFPLWSGGYNQFFFRGEFADIFSFLREGTPAVFQYLFGESHLAQAMLLLWMAGLTMLLLWGLFRNRSYASSITLGLLLLLPFLTLWGAVATGKYPYYPGRHTIILAPFAIAAVSALLAAVVRQKLWAGLALAAAVAVISSSAGYTAEAFPITRDQRRELMTEAVRYVQQSVPANEPILLDNQSSMMAAYYLCAPGEAGAFFESASEFTPFHCGGHFFAALNYRSWMLTEKNLPAKFHDFAKQWNLKPGNRIWMVQLSWRADLDEDLRNHVPAFRCLASTRFGKDIVVFPLQVSPELSAAPVTACGN